MQTKNNATQTKVNPTLRPIAKTKRGLNGLAGLTGLALTVIATATLAAYPEKPIRMVVGFTPGGTVDLGARTIARRLEAHGWQFVIENRTGAGAVIADNYVAAAAPDGYTVLFGSSSMVTQAASRPDYTAHKRLAPIMRVGTLPLTVSALKSAPFKSFPELVAYAKANPGKLNYGVAGFNTGPHLAFELLRSVTGMDIQGVPFPGVAQSQTALLGGQVDLSVTPPMTSDRTVDLVVLSSNRSDVIRDVPTPQEFGIKGFFATTWLGLFAPLGTPKSVLDAYGVALNKVLAEPETRAALIKPPISATPIPNETPELFAKSFEESVTQWQNFLRTSGIKIQ